MANIEAEVKAMDKRIGGLERKIDDYDKQLRQIDYGALVKKLENLEKAMGMLAASLKDPKKFAGGNMLDKESGAKLAEAIAQRESEKAKKESEQIVKKVVADVEKMNIDARIKMLEVQVKQALAMAGAR